LILSSHIFDKKIIPHSRCNQIPQKLLEVIENISDEKLCEIIDFAEYLKNMAALLAYKAVKI
jgi:hypothetical protein